VKVAVVFEPDADLGPDPGDHADPPDERRIGLFLDGDHDDVLLLWRRYGEQYVDGFRTEVVSSGIWEHVTLDQIRDAIGHITELE
jgi:hypothetical protein